MMTALAARRLQSTRRERTLLMMERASFERFVHEITANKVKAGGNLTYESGAIAALQQIGETFLADYFRGMLAL